MRGKEWGDNVVKGVGREVRRVQRKGEKRKTRGIERGFWRKLG